MLRSKDRKERHWWERHTDLHAVSTHSPAKRGVRQAPVLLTTVGTEHMKLGWDEAKIGSHKGMVDANMALGLGLDILVVLFPG